MKKIIQLIWLAVGSVSFAQTSDKVQLINANSLEFDLKATGKVKRLIGDVRFRQNNTLLYCDSAYQYDEENKVDAFGHVHINHQDSIQLYGEALSYEGNSRHARLTGNAKMVDKEMTLTSNALDYDMNANYGYYTGGGKIISGKNTLTSRYGYFYSKTKETFFKTDVVLVNPEYTISTDTLKYRTGNKTAYFYGPTTILSNQDKLFCRYGQYDTEKQIAMFSKNAAVMSKSNIMIADSIYYERQNEFGKAFMNMELYDTVNKVVVYGDYGEMRGKTNESFVTKRAVAKQYMENDSMYVFADSIYSYRQKAGGKGLVKSYRHVRLLKNDMQAVCDSLVYDKSDSTLKLFHRPALWSGNNQITSDTIFMFVKNNKLDSFTLKSNAFMISREAAKQYNQVKGKFMYGSFDQNKIKFLHVNGNGQSIYYAKEDSDYIGVNVIECSEMEFYFKDNRISYGNFINKPDAVLHPLDELKPEELKLKGFEWRSRERPSQTLIMKRFYGKNYFLKKTLFDALNSK